MQETATKIERVQTGIQGFDQLTYGGLPKGRSYLVAGEPGTGKTIFSLQFLLEGLKQNESATFISIDEKPEHIINDAASLGWDLSKYLRNKQLHIIDITNYFSSSNDKEGNMLNIARVVNQIKNYIQSIGPNRLVIDPIAPLILKDSSIPHVIEYIRSLIFEVESLPKCTTLLTSYIPVGSNKVSTFGIEEYAASGIIHLKLQSLNNKRIRTIGIHKMRGTRIALSEYSFEILPSRGVILRQAL